MSLDPHSAWVLDIRDLGRQPGSSKHVSREIQLEDPLGVAGVIEAPAAAPVTVDLLLESVVEGVLVTGTVSVPVEGECARCLDPLSDELELQVTELFAYPDSTTEATTDEDEVRRIESDLLNLEPMVRDAIV